LLTLRTPDGARSARPAVRGQHARRGAVGRNGGVRSAKNGGAKVSKNGRGESQQGRACELRKADSSEMAKREKQHAHKIVEEAPPDRRRPAASRRSATFGAPALGKIRTGRR
jgi:hypothetical protein